MPGVTHSDPQDTPEPPSPAQPVFTCPAAAPQSPAGNAQPSSPRAALFSLDTPYHPLSVRHPVMLRGSPTSFPAPGQTCLSGSRRPLPFPLSEPWGL